MKVKQMINALRAAGHEVSVYHRPDGGQRITAIDGTKYGSGGNKGNEAARRILGVNLTAKQRSQRVNAGANTYEGHNLKVKVQKGDVGELSIGVHKAARITKKERSFLREYNKAARKLNVTLYETTGVKVDTKHTQRVRVEVPRISAKYFRYGKTRFGINEEIRKLKNNLRRGLGYAGEDQVRATIDKLKTYVYLSGRKLGDFVFPKAISYLEAHIYEIDDQTMVAVLQMAYDRKNHLIGDEEKDIAYSEALDENMEAALESSTAKLKKADDILKKVF